MKRTVLVCILALAALGLLIAAALKSRSVPIDVHIAQHTVTTELERVREDFGTLVSSLESAWRTSQNPGDAAYALQERLAESTQRMRDPLFDGPAGPLQTERARNSLESFNTALTMANELTLELLDEQVAYAESAVLLRDTGPQVIQQMRDIALDRVATDMFQLIVGGSKSSCCHAGSLSVSSWICFISARKGIMARFALTPSRVLECAARPRAVARMPYVPLWA